MFHLFRFFFLFLFCWCRIFNIKHGCYASLFYYDVNILIASLVFNENRDSRNFFFLFKTISIWIAKNVIFFILHILLCELRRGDKYKSSGLVDIQWVSWVSCDKQQQQQQQKYHALNIIKVHFIFESKNKMYSKINKQWVMMTTIQTLFSFHSFIIELVNLF